MFHLFAWGKLTILDNKNTPQESQFITMISGDYSDVNFQIIVHILLLTYYRQQLFNIQLIENIEFGTYSGDLWTNKVYIVQ